MCRYYEIFRDISGFYGIFQIILSLFLEHGDTKNKNESSGRLWGNKSSPWKTTLNQFLAENKIHLNFFSGFFVHSFHDFLRFFGKSWDSFGIFQESVSQSPCLFVWPSQCVSLVSSRGKSEVVSANSSPPLEHRKLCLVFFSQAPIKYDVPMWCYY